LLRRKKFLNSTVRVKVIAEKVLYILIIAEYHGIIEIKYQIWESGLQDKIQSLQLNLNFK